LTEATLIAPETRKAERRARRITRRRAEILAAALRVFEREGFEAATTRLIAEEADVSEGTIYNYFPDKGELCIQALKEGSGLAALVEHMERREGGFDAALEALGRWRAARLPRRRALLELWAEILAKPRLRERYQAIIWAPAAQALEAALIAQGAPLAVPPALAARLLMSSLVGLWLMSLADPDLEALLEGGGGAAMADVRRLLWRGFAAD
jgi:AcrR family transcriptional regulator